MKESESERQSDLASTENRLIFHQLTLRAHLPYSFTQVPTSANGSVLHPCEGASGEGREEERGKLKDRKKKKEKKNLMWVCSETLVHSREREDVFEQTNHKKRE